MGCRSSVSNKADIPKEYRSRSSHIEHAELRGLKLVELLKLGKFVREFLDDHNVKDTDPSSPTHGQLMTWDMLTTHQLLMHFVKPWTKANHCSFSEMVLTKETPPHWCVVHWYGQPFAEVLQQLTHHAKSRKLDIKTPYWLCAFAMNQHLLMDSKSRPTAAADENSPLCKALRSSECQGSVLLVDAGCEAMRRFWCLWEVFLLHSQGKGKLHDIVGWIAPNRQRLSRSQPGRYAEEGPVLLQHVDERPYSYLTVPLPEKEGRFPLFPAVRAATSEMEKGSCWNEKARSNLMQFLTKENKIAKVDRVIQRVFWGFAVCESIQSGDPDCLQKLLELSEHAVDSALTGQGDFAMHVAAEQKSSRMLEMLLKSRASPDLRRKSDGASPLYLAALSQCAASVKTLLEFAAEPNAARDTDGAVPAHVAAEGGQTHILEMLVQHGADIHKVRSKDGANMVHLAARSGERECLQYILDKEADPNCQMKEKGNYAQATPLLLALLSKNDAVLCVKALLAMRADPRIADLQGRTPVLVAAENAAQNSLKALLEAGAGPDWGHRAHDGATAAAIAAENGSTECLKLLLAHKANAEATRNDGLTPVHLACQADAPECLKLLHHAKADLNRHMPGHGLPLDFAELHSFHDVAVVLREKGAHGVKFESTRAPVNEGIIVKVVCARELRVADVSGLADPYCIVEAQISSLPEHHARPKFQTPIVSGSCDPVWNYECRIPEFRQSDFLKFTVWDKDMLKVDDNLGVAALPGKRIWPHGFNGELSLARAKGVKGSNAELTVEVRCLGGGMRTTSKVSGEGSRGLSAAYSNLRSQGRQTSEGSRGEAMEF